MFDAARQPQHGYRPSEAFVTRSVIARGVSPQMRHCDGYSSWNGWKKATTCADTKLNGSAACESDALLGEMRRDPRPSPSHLSFLRFVVGSDRPTQWSPTCGAAPVHSIYVFICISSSSYSTGMEPRLMGKCLCAYVRLLRVRSEIDQFSHVS